MRRWASRATEDTGMGQQRNGLRKRGKYWHIRRRVEGVLIAESTGETELERAKEYLERRSLEVRRAKRYGETRTRTFREASQHYVRTSDKRSLERDVRALREVLPWIGQLALREVHMGTLEGYITARRRGGAAAGTVNRTLAVVRRVLNLSARVWRDEVTGGPWLEGAVPLLTMLKGPKRPGHILSVEEERRLLEALPLHLRLMTIFALRTGCRSAEVCGLRWDWERRHEDIRFFSLPSAHTKNGEPRPVVLSRAAAQVIDTMRGVHPEWVFPVRHANAEVGPMQRMYSSAWRRARARAGLPKLQVHDLRRTAASRWRDLGVPEWTIADLLGHKRLNVTRLYALPSLREMLAAVEDPARPLITLVRTKEGQ